MRAWRSSALSDSLIEWWQQTLMDKTTFLLGFSRLFFLFCWEIWKRYQRFVYFSYTLRSAMRKITEEFCDNGGRVPSKEFCKIKPSVFILCDFHFLQPTFWFWHLHFASTTLAALLASFMFSVIWLQKLNINLTKGSLSASQWGPDKSLCRADSVPEGRTRARHIDH